MRPKHNVTWVASRWECICGFLCENDRGAYGHYLNSSPNKSSTGVTEMEMGAEGQFEVEAGIELEMAVD